MSKGKGMGLMWERPLDLYGNEVYQYVGSGELRTNDGNKLPALFDARHMADGFIYMECRVPERPVFDCSSFLLDHGLTFLTSNGDQISTRGSLLIAESGTLIPTLNPDESTRKEERTVFSVEGLRVELGQPQPRPVYEIQVPLFNFPLPFRQEEFEKFSSVEFRHESFHVRITPVYQEEFTDRDAPSGASVGALCSIRSHDGNPVEPDRVASIAEELLKPLSLAIGTRVDCSTMDAIGANGEPVLRIHRNTFIRPFAPIITSFSWNADIPELMGAWFDTSMERHIAIEDLSSAIGIFADACSRQVDLETRCLTACCLLDALALRFAEAEDKASIVADSVFESRILPELTNAMGKVLSGMDAVSTEEREEMLSKISGVIWSINQRSFRRRLKDMFDGLDVPVTGETREQIIKVRNTLVHEAEFRKQPLHGAVSFFSYVGPKKAMGFLDYKVVLWAACCTLLRLVGYRAALPAYTSPPAYSGASRRL